LEPLIRQAHCPVCGNLSRRIHSHYLRQPWDLVWNNWPVQLYILARRFFCDCPDYPRIIFSEPFPKTLKYYAHQMERLQAVLLEMALLKCRGAADWLDLRVCHLWRVLAPTSTPGDINHQYHEYRSG
jgi:hypothetical protein